MRGVIKTLVQAVHRLFDLPCQLFRRRGENRLDSAEDAVEVAVVDGACGSVTEVLEPVPDFAAAFDADDWSVDIGG